MESHSTEYEEYIEPNSTGLREDEQPHGLGERVGEVGITERQGQHASAFEPIFHGRRSFPYCYLPR